MADMTSLSCIGTILQQHLPSVSATAAASAAAAATAEGA